MEDIKISDELKRILAQENTNYEEINYLNLSNININASLAEEIVKLCPNIEELALNKVISADAIRVFSTLKSLDTLKINCAGLSIDALNSIGEIKTITDLQIDIESLDNDDIQFLLKLDNLVNLRIMGGKFNISCLAKLERLEELKQLILLGNELSPAIPRHILHSFDAKKIIKFTKIINMYSESNEALIKGIIGVEGFDYDNSNLACLKLKDIELDYSMVEAIVSYYPNLRALILTNCNIDNNDCKKISELASLNHLYLNNNPRITNEGVESLASLEDLWELDLSSTSIDDDCILSILEHDKLEKLVIQSTDITPYGLKQLANLKNLKKLYILGISLNEGDSKDFLGLTDPKSIFNHLFSAYLPNFNISPGLAKILKEAKYSTKNRELEALALPGVDLNYELIKEIVALYPNLKHLDVNTTGIGDAECELLSKLKNLEWLDISGNSNITNRGIAELCKLTKLKWLDISLSDLDDDCVDDLLKLQNLELLLISATRLSVFCLYKLNGLPKLQHLDLIRTDAGDKLPYKLVQTKNARQILDFIEMKSNDNVPVCNYRLMVLGEPGCGKTTIYSKITGDYRKETSTLGINIKPFDAKLIDDNMQDVNLNIWDFGGQDYQTSIHEIFLSENCLFTIVVEPRMNDSAKNFKKWYDLVKRYVHIRDLDSFPLIVLFSKIDDMNGGLGYLVNGEEGLDKLKSEITDIIRADLKNRLGEENPDCKLNIRFIKSSAVKENGLADYMSTLQESFIKIIKNNSIVVSKEAQALGHELARRRESSFYLDLKAVRAIYRDINEKLNIANPERIERALSLLSYYGDILYLPNTRYVFIDPNTISEIIYNLLINAKYPEALKKFDEYLRPERIRALDLEDGEGLGLVGKEYEDMPSDLWEILLKVFSDNDLLVNIGNNEYLIPSRASYLPHSSIYDKLREYNSTTEYSLEGSRHFVISFELESKGILYKLESKLAKELENEGFIDTEIYSNAFIVKASINSKKEIAIFYQESLSNEIDFYISEGSVENGLFVKINNSINSLEIPFKLYAVCPCKGRSENECSYRYDLSELKNASTDNSFLIHCVNSQRLLPVRAFLRSSIINTDQLVVGSKHRSIAKDNIFVIMPFGNGGNKDKYDAMFKAIKESASEANELLKLDTALKDPIGEIVRVDKRPDDGKTIDEMIINHIQESSIIITILEGNRPNCYFEYGMARCYQGKSFITISAKGDELPFDVDHHQIKFIDRNDYENNYKELRAIISKDLRAILLERHKNS